MDAVLKQRCDLTHELGQEWRGEGIYSMQSRYEPQGKLLDQLLPVIRPFVSSLLLFDDSAANFPIGCNHDRVNRPVSLITRLG